MKGRNKYKNENFKKRGKELKKVLRKERSKRRNMRWRTLK